MSAPESRVMVLYCPGLAGPRTARAFDQVLTAVTAFCPAVEAVEPGVSAFGARGPARYFGGETALAARITAAIADLGVESQAGAADGLFAAYLAARAAGAPRADTASGICPVLVIPPGRTPEFLARQPVSVLARQPVSALAGQDAAGDLAGQDFAALLSRLGLHTLGDLAALSPDDVASRFGAAGETAHRLARGLGSRPLAVRPPAEDLSVAQEFDPPEPLSEPVVFAAKALAERMHQALADRGLTCVRVQVRAVCADGRENRRLWRHDGLLSAAALADRVRWQLDGWRVPAPLAGFADGTTTGSTTGTTTGTANGSTTGTTDSTTGTTPDGTTDGGIVVLRLVPDEVVHATGHQLALWGETVVSDRVARAAMRVQAILGHEAVLRPALGGGRDVAEQVNDVPFGEKRQSRLAVGAPWPGRIMGAVPGVVYPFAREADVTDDAGDAVTVTGRCVISAAPAWLAADGVPPLRITGWAGPWPLSERWWDPAAARRRARFQLLTDDGRAWLAAVQDGRWLIEGGYC